MYCRNCGSKIEENGKFCHCCGKKLYGQNETMEKLNQNLKNLYMKVLSKLRLYEHIPFKKIFRIGSICIGLLSIIVILNTWILPVYKTIQINKGMKSIENMAYEDAIEAFTAASNFDRNNPDIYKYMGQAYLNIDDFENAGISLSKALESNDTDMEIYRLLSEVYLYEEDYLNYETTLKTFIDLYPNDPYGYLRLGEYYQTLGSFDRAQAILEELLKREENEEAVKLLYNVYLESYMNNKSSEKAKILKDKAYKYLSDGVKKEILEFEGQDPISISPDSKYMVTRIYEKNRQYLCVYERQADAFLFQSRYDVPILYTIGGGDINWSKDSTKFVFFNSTGAPYSADSYIYLCDILADTLTKISDPGDDFQRFMDNDLFFMVDSNPTWSEDGERIYFARYSSGGNGLCAIDLDGENIELLYEPDEGGLIKHKIIERNGVLYFSVVGLENSPAWGLYKYENGEGEKLRFEYDDRFFYLALTDISPDGRYLLYHVTKSSQNNSFFFHILDLDTMKLIDIYPQDIDYVGSEFTSINRMDFFGEKQIFICKNALFMQDGKSILVAEEGRDFSGKTLRKVDLESGSSQFLYLSFDLTQSHLFCLNNEVGASKDSQLKELDNGNILIYDEGLKIIYQ